MIGNMEKEFTDRNCQTKRSWDLPSFRIALVEPEIPQNTGNIGRLSLATGCELSLVGKLGFEIDEKAVRRAGLDYWKHVQINEHKDKEAWLDQMIESGQRFFFFSTKAKKSIWETEFQAGDTLVFGSETRGLPESWLERCPENLCSLPVFDEKVRSLNLSNAVSVAVYEGLRQLERS
jgi:tRNA (cytidine/uridine-2'-O-)-methyltransferase